MRLRLIVLRTLSDAVVPVLAVQMLIRVCAERSVYENRSYSASLKSDEGNGGRKGELTRERGRFHAERSARVQAL
jgi:hypothetical protein